MSNSVNTRHRREVLTKTFANRGRGTEGKCERPSRDAGTKADFEEFHREKMKSRKIHRYTRQVNARGPWHWRKTKSHDAAYRKSIWPKSKTAQPGRMG